MGGGFGSKFGPDAQGLICAKLAQQAKAPVKLMLDRKEEHLDTGNRPSATAHIRAGVTARRRADGLRRSELGHRRRRPAGRVPAAVHLQLPEPQAHAQGRLHQRGPAARDARARTSAGLLPDGNPDGRARGPREDGSGRVPREEPAAARAERDVGRLLRDRARSSLDGTNVIRPAIRRRDRSRPAWACRRIAGAAPAAARRRTSTSCPTAAWS